jgi:hypothetical protein
MKQTSPPASPGWRATAFCFGLPLIAYACTAARTVQGGDTGEFGCIALLGGVAHPPGYPLYTLLARIAGLVPVGAPFLRISLLSSICGAAACAVLMHVGWRVTGRLGAAVVAALGFALSPLAWRLAGVPEVFSLHALLSAGILLLSLRFAEGTGDRPWREAFALGLGFGLGLANHQTTLFVAPVVLWAIVACFRRVPIPVAGISTIILGAGVLLGLSTYLLLPVFTHLAGPEAVVWGRTDTVGGFLDHVLRREYGTFQLFAGAQADRAASGRQVEAFLIGLGRQNVYVLAVAGVAGAVLLPRRRPGFALALLTAFALAGILFSSLLTLPETGVYSEVSERFHLLPNLLFSVLIAVGLAELEARMSPRLFAGACGAVLALGCLSAVRSADWARDASIEQFMKAEVEGTAPNAVILGEGDGNNAGVLWVTRVLHDRPDVHYLDPNFLVFDWYAARKKAEMPSLPIEQRRPRLPAGLLGESLARYAPIYVIIPLKSEADMVGLEPAGFLDRIVPSGSPALPLPEVEARLRKATTTLGAQPEPADAWAAVSRRQARVRWLDLAEAYRQAGQLDKFKSAGEEGLSILPPELDDTLPPSDR